MGLVNRTRKALGIWQRPVMTLGQQVQKEGRIADRQAGRKSTVKAVQAVTTEFNRKMGVKGRGVKKGSTGRKILASNLRKNRTGRLVTFGKSLKGQVKDAKAGKPNKVRMRINGHSKVLSKLGKSKL